MLAVGRMQFGLACLCSMLSAAAVQAAAPPTAEAQKPVKALINAVRYGKYDLAAKQLGFTEMVKRLLLDNWSKLTPVEQQEAAKGLETIIRATSFPKGKDMFAHLDAVLFEDARAQDADAHCRSTIVVHRDYKKTELVIDWVLFKDGESWRITDLVMLGESTLAGIREEQVQPLLQEGGVQAVLSALRAKVAEVKKKQP